MTLTGAVLKTADFLFARHLERQAPLFGSGTCAAYLARFSCCALLGGPLAVVTPMTPTVPSSRPSPSSGDRAFAFDRCFRVALIAAY